MTTKELARKFNVTERYIHYRFCTRNHYKGYEPVGYKDGTNEYIWEYKGDGL
jgi:hypothetical protein